MSARLSGRLPQENRQSLWHGLERRRASAGPWSFKALSVLGVNKVSACCCVRRDGHFGCLLLRTSVFETSSFTLWQQLTIVVALVSVGVCELALLALPHTNETVFTDGNSFSLYFVLAQEPQTTVIHNPDGNKVFRKNQLHLAFPPHTFHPLFHSTIGPFQEFPRQLSFLHLFHLASPEPVFICVHVLCACWWLLSC